MIQEPDVVVWDKTKISENNRKHNPPGTKTFQALDSSDPPPPNAASRSLYIQIQQARNEKKMTQKMLASNTNILLPDLSRIERGDLVPTKKQIMYIEKALCVKFTN